MEKIEEAVKDEREFVLAIARRITPADSPVAFNSQIQQQQPFPTPSPFSFSVASTGWSSRSSIHHHSTLLLRFSVLLFSFISALILAAPSTKKKHQPSPSFTDYPELIYCFIVASIAFLYTALQLFKGVCDIAHRGILISDMALDYVSFFLDQASAIRRLLSLLLSLANVWGCYVNSWWVIFSCHRLQWRCRSLDWLSEAHHFGREPLYRPAWPSQHL
ncbi:CASP-like protein 4A4 isoform X1 [Hibiscus syriacus]|uniref:CASP-like protein 4A4 isoform X1 n=1 Tax=Hibiscus syriacus TaxID=106335 RepID=UPI0019208BED|nr:CASP-like protein 4A4 isoform X1 [Hibiscus syriacus]